MPAPVLYLSHGAPPLADDARWTRELADWSATIERPKDILMVSAHWEAAPVALSSTTGAPLLYDFWGFPQHYYEVTYAAPPAPGLAHRTEGLLTDAGLSVARDESRGLDHGAYVPLVEMYPEADIPVVQLSLPTLNPRTLFAVGERLAPLARGGHAHRRVGLHDPQPELVQPWRRARRGTALAVPRVRPLGRRGDGGAGRRLAA
jgi:4,5-DOPA dioxygenase extradiol